MRRVHRLVRREARQAEDAGEDDYPERDPQAAGPALAVEGGP